MHRIEKDFAGEVKLQQDVLYGIHAYRAQQNFPDKTPFHIEWYKAVGLTKLACYNTYKNFKKAALSKFKISDLSFNFFDDNIIEQLIKSAEEVIEGKYFEYFIVPAVQGGAGTSINMNINEIISNSILKRLEKNAGEYHIIDPFEHANIYQSTNDVIPTALKIATIQKLIDLEEAINELRFEIEKLEKNNRNSLRVAYTQMQEAVPSSYSKLFSCYNDALSRDWWRVSKCFERIKVVNLGGSAIGSSLAVPRYFVMEVVPELQKLTHLPITKSENNADTTNNLDSFVEIHGILKAHAVNLEKIASDIRMLSSELIGSNDIEIPQKQVGSSIMPSKINPVIPEYIISVAHKIYSNDLLISSLSGQGMLDLNAYLPLIGHALLDSLKLLISANQTFKNNLFKDLKVNYKSSNKKLFYSPSVTTALSPFIGYHKSAELAKLMRLKKINIFDANKELNLLDDNKLNELLKPQNLLKTGFSLNDIID